MKWLNRWSIWKQKREADKWVTVDKKVAEYVQSKYKELGMDFDSTLTYLNTRRLDKHSRTLGWWTVAIVFLTLVLAVSTVFDIGSKLCWW